MDLEILSDWNNLWYKEVTKRSPSLPLLIMDSCRRNESEINDIISLLPRRTEIYQPIDLRLIFHPKTRY